MDTENIKYVGVLDKNGHKIYLNCKVKFRNNYYKVVEYNGFGDKREGVYILELMNNIPFVVNHLDLLNYHKECEINKK
ncbi:hypothetical protein EXQ31_09445 [Clostridium botulinum]|nr:hypothetical protein [Clostridium botulinum]RFM20761.1 hypothetical protein C1146_15165 [Clostridium botulinum]